MPEAVARGQGAIQRQNSEVRRDRRGTADFNKRASVGRGEDAAAVTISNLPAPQGKAAEALKANAGRRRIQDEILNSEKRQDGGKSGKIAEPPSPNPSTSPTSQPVGTPIIIEPSSTSETSKVESVSSTPTDGVFALAERYVQQYEEKGGLTLSTEDRSAKVQEVYSFYSDPSRTGRLEKIVFQ